MTMKISACWIAKDEAENIGRSIESVIDIADELIIVDTGSTDETVSIVESYGAKVGHFQWVNDFAAARNHAMDLASEDIIISIDADEWFEPKLVQADREQIVSWFASDPLLEMITVKLTNIDRESGKPKNVGMCSRIFRNSATMRYTGKIHESIKPTHFHGNRFEEALNINHTGYSGELSASKGKRNYEILQEWLNADDIAIEDRMLCLVYLTRETYNVMDLDEAFGYLGEILKHPKILQKILGSHHEGFTQFIYNAIDIVLDKRSQVSRRDVYQKLIMLFKTAYPFYRGTAEIDLVYQMYFDYKEDRFLKELRPAVIAAESLPPTAIAFYKDYERILYSQAAFASWRRGDVLLTMEYAVNALKGGSRNERTLVILLTAIKRQPLADVVQLLGSLFDFSISDDLDYLIRCTNIDGFLDLHAHFLNKRLELGNAPLNYFLKLMLIYKKHDELVCNTAQAYEKGRKDVLAYIIMAAICGAPPEMIAAHAGMLEDCAHILEAYIKREPLEEVSERDAQLLKETYAMAAFAAGIDIADRYLDIYRADSKLCYLTKAAYCEMSGLHEPILREDMNEIGSLDFECYSYRIQAMIFKGLYEEALTEIKRFLNAGFLEQDILHMLLVIAEKAPGETQTAALKLYEQYIGLVDTMIDLQDVVNTGIVFDGGGVKMKKTFKGMKRTQLDKLIREEAERPAAEALPELCRKAVHIYKDKGILAEAARCLICLIAHDQAGKEDYECLAEVFADMKNITLSKYVKKHEWR